MRSRLLRMVQDVNFNGLELLGRKLISGRVLQLTENAEKTHINQHKHEV
jgi:hypothetical protein